MRSGFAAVTGDIILIQDADLECPQDYPTLLEPLLSGKADAVSAHILWAADRTGSFFLWHMVCNQFLTLLSSMFTTQARLDADKLAAF